MSITVCSMFRDSQVWHGNIINQVDIFFNQIESQSIKPDKLCLLEGDSIDSTYKDLKKRCKKSGINFSLLKKDTGKGAVESTTNPDRLTRLSELGNTLLAASLLESNSKIFWVESDIIFNSTLLERLHLSMNQLNCQVIAPLILLQHSNYFYDTWGFTNQYGKNPENCGYEEVLNMNQAAKVPMLSVGTCVLMDADFLRKKQISFGSNCFRGLCSQIIENGGKIFLDKSVAVYHPSRLFVEKRLI